MKAVLLITVLLSCVLTVTAAAVGAAEAVPAAEEPQKENQVVAVEAAPVAEEPQKENQVAAVEPAPAVEELEEVNQDEVNVVVAEEEVIETLPEIPSPFEGRFFSCPTGWVRQGSGCYLFVSSSQTWSNALNYCNSLGATLPSVHDLFEYSFLQDLTLRSGQTVSWLGGFYFLGWKWVDQSSFNYNNFNSQLSVSSYPCIYLNTRVGWSNQNCAGLRPSICVKRTDSC